MSKNIAHDFYTALSGEGEEISIKRISETEYLITGEDVSADLTFTRESDSFVDARGIQNLPYTFTHSEGEKWSVNGINAWGIYLDGVDSYLEAIGYDEYFLDANGGKYKKINFKSMSSFPTTIWDNGYVFTHSRADILVDANDERGLIVGSSTGGETEVSVNSINEIMQVTSNGNYEYYFDGTLGLTMGYSGISNAARMAIGKERADTYSWWNVEIWNIELGIHKAKMRGFGNQIVNDDNIPFLNLKGGAEWVII